MLLGRACAAQPAGTWSARAMRSVSRVPQHVYFTITPPISPAPRPVPPLSPAGLENSPSVASNISSWPYPTDLRGGSVAQGLGGRTGEVYLLSFRHAHNARLRPSCLSGAHSSAPKMRTTNTLLVLSALAASTAVRLIVNVALRSPHGPTPVSAFFRDVGDIPEIKRNIGATYSPLAARAWHSPLTFIQAAKKDCHAIEAHEEVSPSLPPSLLPLPPNLSPQHNHPSLQASSSGPHARQAWRRRCPTPEPARLRGDLRHSWAVVG